MLPPTLPKLRPLASNKQNIIPLKRLFKPTNQPRRELQPAHRGAPPKISAASDVNRLVAIAPIASSVDAVDVDATRDDARV
jgi:hypothetical protein